MNVFVLAYLSDPTDDTSSNDVLGVFTNNDDARIAMKGYFNGMLEELDITDEEISDYNAKIYEGETDCSIYHYGSFYEWRIYQFEI
jgi:hypothetical protein